MRMLLLATLVLAPGLEGASLGIGVDVFDRAYEFAATRVGAPPTLTLRTCTEARCLWTLGDSVTVTADHPVESLDVNRIEVTLEPGRPVDPDLRRRYEQACLTIVALVDPSGPASARRDVASAIASPDGPRTRRIRIERSDRGISVYGMRAPAADRPSATISRCGAVAAF